MSIFLEYMSRKQLAEYLGCCVRTVANLDALGEGPPRVKVAGRIFYPRDGVDQWLRSRVQDRAAAE